MKLLVSFGKSSNFAPAIVTSVSGCSGEKAAEAGPFVYRLGREIFIL